MSDRTQFADLPKLLSSILETMGCGLFTVDCDRVITTWNRAMEDLTGYTAKEALGQHCSMLEGDPCFQGGDHRSAEPCSLFEKGEVRKRQCSLRHRDGRTIPILKTARLLHDASGEVVGGMESVADLSPVLSLREEVQRLRRNCPAEGGTSFFVGDHPRVQVMSDMLDAATRTSASVLILGETGTGKELVAKAIHAGGARAAEPYVRVGCGALSETLLESELFGHVRGAFTGAVAARTGRFEAAHRGTLFLDEIGDISPTVQQKLLRVLQEREFERVGENRPIKVDIQVIAATNKDIESLVADGSFRGDLYYRLAVIPISVPALRERASDIPLLVEHFLGGIHRSSGRSAAGITREAMGYLMRYEWPGNVRELEHAITFASAVNTGKVIAADHLPPRITGRVERPRLRPGTRLERGTILAALEEAGGNREAAARRLGVGRVTLWKWMKRLGIEYPTSRSL